MILRNLLGSSLVVSLSLLTQQALGTDCPDGENTAVAPYTYTPGDIETDVDAANEVLNALLAVKAKLKVASDLCKENNKRAAYWDRYLDDLAVWADDHYGDTYHGADLKSYWTALLDSWLDPNTILGDFWEIKLAIGNYNYSAENILYATSSYTSCTEAIADFGTAKTTANSLADLIDQMGSISSFEASQILGILNGLAADINVGKTCAVIGVMDYQDGALDDIKNDIVDIVNTSTSLVSASTPTNTWSPTPIASWTSGQVDNPSN